MLYSTVKRAGPVSYACVYGSGPKFSDQVRHSGIKGTAQQSNCMIVFTMANCLSSYKVVFKVQAVDWLRSHGQNVSAAAREFGVDRKRIREWDKQYTRLLQYKGGALHFRYLTSWVGGYYITFIKTTYYRPTPLFQHALKWPAHGRIIGTLR